MIEQYFQKGAIVTGHNFKDGSGGAPLTEISRDVRESTVTISDTKKAKIWFGLRTKTTTTSAQVRFRFLPYMQGSINYCESHGVDVLSAYFSGCIMARYTRAGSWRVCHVSTGKPNDCKEAWLDIQREKTVLNVRQFKPDDHVTAERVLGLITATGDRYAIGCSPIDLLETERRSVDQIIREYPFTSGTSEDDKRKMAKIMVKTKLHVQALRVDALVKV